MFYKLRAAGYYQDGLIGPEIAREREERKLIKWFTVIHNITEHTNLMVTPSHTNFWCLKELSEERYFTKSAINLNQIY